VNFVVNQPLAFFPWRPLCLGSLYYFVTLGGQSVRPGQNLVKLSNQNGKSWNANEFVIMFSGDGSTFTNFRFFVAKHSGTILALAGGSACGSAHRLPADSFAADSAGTGRG
jgi:hypothetical protein